MGLGSKKTPRFPPKKKGFSQKEEENKAIEQCITADKKKRQFLRKNKLEALKDKSKIREK